LPPSRFIFSRIDGSIVTNILIVLVCIAWATAACFRAYRLARFFQIEEYMPGRFLRWQWAGRARWYPRRIFAVVFIGCILQFFLSEGGSLLPGLLGLAVAALVAVPPDEGEVKKKFNPTPRARRLVGTTWAWIAVFMVASAVLAGALATRFEDGTFVALTLLGTAGFVLSPVWLVLGSLTMAPLESWLRGRFVRRACQTLAETRPVVIGITGSYGKTTTKNYLAHLLNGRYRAYATPKSYNTMMGVCIAINNDLANDRSIEYFIAEMGAYIPGEIRRIADLTHPTISIVVEVGPQHLERFGSVDNVAVAKYEIITALPPDGVGVFNVDNPYIRAMYDRGYPATRIAVSRVTPPDQAAAQGIHLVATDVTESLHGLSFTLHDTRTGEHVAVTTPLVGAHNVTNILLSAAVAQHEGIPLRDIARRAATLQPAESRLVRQITPQGITIINDAYSANPVGVLSSLAVLKMHQTGRRLLITPGMVELGELMEPENYKLGTAAADAATDVILVGREQTRPIRDGLLASGFPESRLLVVDALGEAVMWYQSNLAAGDCVLFLNDLPDTYNR
jgi:UDP-N-acetylmuramoyl-tripeptide--D-alanyl-D-alanine ligase